LLRLSLAPSAVGDALAGLLIGCGGSYPGAGDALLLVLASLGVYHGSLALNDWCDRAHDAATRPDRPIPSGAVSEHLALGIGFGLLFLGVICAALATPWAGAWMAGVAMLAVLYNRQGRGPRTGPLLLALCRGGNLATGSVYALASGFSLEPAPVLLAVMLYGSYVFLVSKLGRMEDGEDPVLPRQQIGLLLISAAALLVAAGTLFHGPLTETSRFPAVLVAVGGSTALLLEAVRQEVWTPSRVGRCMGLCLRRLLLFGVLYSWNTGGWTGAITAGVLLLGYPVSWSLRRWFPPS